MATSILGLDIGGANLKAATPDKRAISVPFPLWKQPEKLPAALAELVGKFPDAEELAVTMTGELCDCFETKRDGVHAIIKAVRGASGGRPIRVWCTDGGFLNSEEAKENHMKVAAANWHALATFAGGYVPEGRAILVDVGSTTTDIIPILDGEPVPEGKTDYERIRTRELLYTGVRRTPLCSLTGFFGAAELFATTLDAYLVLGLVPEDPIDRDTADGRPATKPYARARICRMLCADPEEVPEGTVENLARELSEQQQSRVKHCADYVADRLAPMLSATPFNPTVPFDRLALTDVFNLVKDQIKYIVSGSGEFLARLAVRGPHHVSLNDRLGPSVSACAPAYAVAVLATERRK